MIHLTNLTYHYRRGTNVLESLDLQIDSGSICGLLGRNGAGKSTLLKVIAGLVIPQEGEVSVLGYDPKKRDPNFLSEVFLITEEFTLLGFSIERYYQLYSSFYPRFNHEAFRNYLEEFGLSGGQKLDTLSYGQKKKFLLSFGLATDCRLLLLDEPTNGLDIPSKSLFRKLVASAIHDERSFIISTHQVRDMENLIDPILVLEQGQIVFHQNLEAISRRLSIKRANELPEEGLIYHESYLGGYTILTENQDMEDTHMNLEILYNAIANNQDKMKQVFNQQIHE